MSKTNPKPDTQILTIRFPVALVRKLDRYVKRFEKEFPGISFQRTDAVRLFVERGITGPMVPERPREEDPKPRKTKSAKKSKAKAAPKKDIKSRLPAKRKPAARKAKPKKKR